MEPFFSFVDCHYKLVGKMNQTRVSGYMEPTSYKSFWLFGEVMDVPKLKP
jgi:hypothetical protein